MRGGLDFMIDLHYVSNAVPPTAVAATTKAPSLRHQTTLKSMRGGQDYLFGHWFTEPSKTSAESLEQAWRRCTSALESSEQAWPLALANRPPYFT